VAGRTKLEDIGEASGFSGGPDSSLFVTPEWRRLIPTSRQIVPEAWHAMLSFLSFHVVETPGGYNALQQLSYAAVIFLLVPLSIATGVAMSPAVAARFPWYIKIFHGRQSARSLHLLALCAFIVFFTGHVTIVALHGFRSELALIVLGQTHDPQSTLTLVVWLFGLTGIVAIHVMTTVCSRRRPRFVQKATQSITDPVRTFLFGHEISTQRYSYADISPYFWVNGRPPKEERFLAMAHENFANYSLEIGGLVERQLRLPSTVASRAGQGLQNGVVHLCITSSNFAIRFPPRATSFSMRSTINPHRSHMPKDRGTSTARFAWS
jgi:sulfoxide reductase catalytic subunit YedY